MKKLVSALLSLCIAAGAMPVVQRYAPESVITAHSGITGGGEIIDEYPEGELLFMVLSDYAMVRSNYIANNENLTIAKGDIVIPSEYRGVPVTGIYGFENCTELTSITLPDTITKIADYTFENCTSLETITIPESVKIIGYDAFEGTPWLENKRNESPMVIVNSVLVDGKNCKGEVIIPDNVTCIADHAFMNCEIVESVSIPESVEYIGRKAFLNTGWLNKLNAENELVIVNDFLLSADNCGEDLIIPDNVKSVTGHTADYHKTLKSITIPESVKHIGPAAFYCCPELESVTILSTDCEIESYAAFSNGRRSEDPRDVCFNGTIYAYAGSTAQTYAEKYGYKFEPISEDITSGTSQPTTSSTVTSAPDTTVTSVQTTSYKGYEEFYVDIVSDCPTISHCFTGLYGDVVLPEKQDGVVIEKLGDNAFWKCRDISAITVPENYKYIGRDAFDYKGLLRSITFLNPDIVFDENKNSVDPDVTIYGYRNSTAQAYAEKYGCKFRALEDPFLKGDANLDDKVNISDAVLVMQVATNPDKYGKFRTKSSITSKGEELADVDGTPGLTNSDALLIQKYKLGLVSSL
ncbi:leucine-rich repeat protein [uncultured Ruminococcus sp.]|uniref:leucine-rich repeat protein n=1 Tax=uncultured Ruminococcus sp. TaxID=165186 RepID=UPI00261CA687|nr:leucine-rich repeat protein [uncultured Ruminococcus sp.]